MVTQKINKIWIYSLLFRVIMDLYYIFYVNPNWAYMGLELNINLSKIGLSYLLQLFIFRFIEWDKNTLSGVALQILYIVMIIPLFSFYALNDQNTSFILACTVSFFLSSLLIRNWHMSNKYYAILLPNYYYSILKLLIMIIVIYVVAITIQLNGFHLGTLNIFDSDLIYSIRSKGNGISGMLGYIHGWCHRVIIPLFLAFCLERRSKKGIIASFVVSFILYISDPHKEIILGPVFVLLLYLFGKKINYGKLLIVGFLFFISLGMIGYLMIDLEMAFWGLDILMRIFHIPASIKYMHFSYFSEFPFLYFSEGLIGRMLGIDYPYTNSSGRVVTMYMKGVNSNSNTGYLAYAFDDFGYIGIVMTGILLALYLKIMDQVILQEDRKWIAAGLSYMVILLNDIGFFQWLLSGGGIIAFWIVYIYSSLRVTKLKNVTHHIKC